jgi:hypothetical protein
MQAYQCEKLRTKEEAQQILNSFPCSILDFFINLGQLAFQSRESIYQVAREMQMPEMPDGWNLEVWDHFFYIGYGEKWDQDIDGFWIPEIIIEFDYPEEGKVTAKKRVWLKPPLGICMCGQEIRPMRRLVLIRERAKSAKRLEKIFPWFKTLWWKLYFFLPRWRLAEFYNRCPGCTPKRK